MTAGRAPLVKIVFDIPTAWMDIVQRYLEMMYSINIFGREGGFHKIIFTLNQYNRHCYKYIYLDNTGKWLIPGLFLFWVDTWHHQRWPPNYAYLNDNLKFYLLFENWISKFKCWAGNKLNIFVSAGSQESNLFCLRTYLLTIRQA